MKCAIDKKKLEPKFQRSLAKCIEVPLQEINKCTSVARVAGVAYPAANSTENTSQIHSVPWLLLLIMQN